MSTAYAFELFMTEVWDNVQLEKDFNHAVKTAVNIFGARAIKVGEDDEFEDRLTFLLMEFPDKSTIWVKADGHAVQSNQAKLTPEERPVIKGASPKTTLYDHLTPNAIGVILKECQLPSNIANDLRELLFDLDGSICE